MEIHSVMALYTGLIYLQIYLWLVKDFSWSQLHWFYTGIIFGSLSVILLFLMIILTLWKRIFSETVVVVGLSLWVFSNYWWMIGEIWPYYMYDKNISLVPEFFVPDLMEEYEYGGGDLFYDEKTEEAKCFSLAAVAVLFFSVFILPWFYFDRDRVMEVCLMENETLPRFRFPFFFRDFLEYENLHVFFWALKDCFWIYGNQVGYMVGLALTSLFMLDTIYLYWTSKSHLVDLIHYFVLLLWVAANGFWAYGELFIESPKENESFGYWWDEYQFFPAEKESYEYFFGRNTAGWCYVAALALVVFFYIYWILWGCCTKKLDLNKIELEEEKKIEELLTET
eukprot:snap_masked-scaffold_7-processed-gene-12.23-mRNA-1 protein AED:1.00 eAED:1.00 QI:0/0/0/0/1/1/2/0/337